MEREHFDVDRMIYKFFYHSFILGQIEAFNVSFGQFSFRHRSSFCYSLECKLLRILLIMLTPFDDIVKVSLLCTIQTLGAFLGDAFLQLLSHIDVLEMLFHIVVLQFES